MMLQAIPFQSNPEVQSAVLYGTPTTGGMIYECIGGQGYAAITEHLQKVPCCSEQRPHQDGLQSVM